MCEVSNYPTGVRISFIDGFVRIQGNGLPAGVSLKSIGKNRLKIKTNGINKHRRRMENGGAAD